jgi:hypothetical protein
MDFVERIVSERERPDVQVVHDIRVQIRIHVERDKLGPLLRKILKAEALFVPLPSPDQQLSH